MITAPRMIAQTPPPTSGPPATAAANPPRMNRPPIAKPIHRRDVSSISTSQSSDAGEPAPSRCLPAPPLAGLAVEIHPRRLAAAQVEEDLVRGGWLRRR